ncbi:hypothetical protein Droror1_Dr00010563 [Drosera rotundifolia]
MGKARRKEIVADKEHPSLSPTYSRQKETKISDLLRHHPIPPPPPSSKPHRNRHLAIVLPRRRPPTSTPKTKRFKTERFKFESRTFPPVTHLATSSPPPQPPTSTLPTTSTLHLATSSQPLQPPTSMQPPLHFTSTSTSTQPVTFLIGCFFFVGLVLPVTGDPLLDGIGWVFLLLLLSFL